MKIKCNTRTVAEGACGPPDSTLLSTLASAATYLPSKWSIGRWAIAPQYIEQFRTVLYIFQASGPTIQRDCPSVKWSDAAER